MSNYFLPPYVHFCRRGDAFVFLDLKRDDYLLVNGAPALALKAHCETTAADKPAPRGCRALQELLEGGLLTRDRNSGRDIAPTSADVALEPLVDADLMLASRPTVGNTWIFAAACVRAALQLRRNRIEDTVRAVWRRKAAHCALGAGDLQRARELTTVFQRLRFFFPLNHLCLYDSLALLEFLACYRIFPTWVFGVRLEPWAAHCWVQGAGYNFNEDPEKAAGFTPIMTV